MALPLAIAGIRKKLLAAIQALAGRFLFHRLAQNEPPNLLILPASKKKILARHTSEQDEEQDEGRRALWEAIEENARAEESAFQTGQFIGFLYRRSQRMFVIDKRGSFFAKICGWDSSRCTLDLRDFLQDSFAGNSSSGFTLSEDLELVRTHSVVWR